MSEILEFVSSSSIGVTPFFALLSDMLSRSAKNPFEDFGMFVEPEKVTDRRLCGLIVHFAFVVVDA